MPAKAGIYTVFASPVFFTGRGNPDLYTGLLRRYAPRKDELFWMPPLGYCNIIVAGRHSETSSRDKAPLSSRSRTRSGIDRGIQCNND